MRLVGNILLLVAHRQNYSNLNLVIAGSIFQGIGYTWILFPTLYFYTRATEPRSTTPPPRPRNVTRGFLLAGALAGRVESSRNLLLINVLHLVNIVGLILLIVGFSTMSFPFVQLPATARAGDVIYVVVTGTIILMVAYQLTLGQKKSKAWGKEHQRVRQILLIFIALALPFMSVRAVYVVIKAFSSNPLTGSVAARAVLQYVMEIVAVAIYTVMGFFVDAATNNSWDDVSKAPGSGDDGESFALGTGDSEVPFKHHTPS